MLNKIIVMGRCGRDPEKRMTASGKPVTSLVVACDRDFGNDGQKETDWFDVVAFGGTADFLANHFVKGKMIIVSGRLQKRKWTDKNGNNRETAEIVAENVYFGDSKKDIGDKFQAAMSNNEPLQDFAVVDGDDDNLPF